MLLGTTFGKIAEGISKIFSSDWDDKSDNKEDIIINIEDEYQRNSKNPMYECLICYKNLSNEDLSNNTMPCGHKICSVCLYE